MTDQTKNRFDLVRSIVEHRRVGVLELVNKVLEAPHMLATDLDVLQEAREDFARGMAGMLQQIDVVSTENDEIAFKLLCNLNDITRGLLFCAARATTSASAKKYYSIQQAQLARVKRQDSPAEQALQNAVREIWAGMPEITRNKRGLPSRILDRVNKQMIAGGHEKVGVDAVRRRLAKLRS